MTAGFAFNLLESFSLPANSNYNELLCNSNNNGYVQPTQEGKPVVVKTSVALLCFGFENVTNSEQEQFPGGDKLLDELDPKCQQKDRRLDQKSRRSTWKVSWK